MRNWKEIGKKLLFPPVWVVLLLVAIATVAMAVYMISRTSKEINTLTEK